MLYKNSLKLIFSNFSCVWKILLYILIFGGVCFGLGYVVAIPTINVLKAENWFIFPSETFKDLFAMDIRGFVDNFGEGVLSFNNIISANFSSIWASVVGLIFVLVFFNSMVSCFYLMPVCNTLYYYMGSTCSKSLLASFIETINKNIKYFFVYLITIFPIRALAMFLVVKILIWASAIEGALIFIAPLLVIVVYIVFSAIKITLFNGWVPSQITLDLGVFEGLIEGIKTSNRRKLKIFSNAISLMLSVIILNVFACICTFGAGLIITIPLSLMWLATFNMVSFYTSFGIKFYVDPYNFLSPLKRELTEKFDKMKYLV